MAHPREFGPVTVALLASVVVHALVILPGLVALVEADVDDELLAAAELDSARDSNDLTLGIDESTVSSLTWVGYREYEEHLAALAQHDQAAFEMESAAPGAAPSPPVTEMADAATPEPEVEPAQPQAPDINEPDTEPDGEPEDAFLLPALESLPDDAAMIVDEVEKVEPARYLAPFFRRVNDLLAAAARAAETREEYETHAEALSPAEHENRTTPADPGQQGSRPTESPAPPADVAEKESDATSTIDVPSENWKAGKPIASSGLELLPKKPEFTLLTRITASPRNPLCRLRFDRSGRVIEVELHRPTGDSRVDRALISSLYAWRARGERLESLEDEDFIDVQVRIVFIEGRDA